MKLSTLLKSLGDYKIYEDKDIQIASISDDSRKVKKRGLFVAVAGLTVDGHEFIDEVIKKGVAAIVGEKKPKKTWLKKTTYIRVKNSRKALALLASAWFGFPSKKLKIIGVTGTKGKTTVCEFLYQILKTAGKKVGLVSTIAARIGNKDYDTGLHVTNPEPLILQKFLKKIAEAECEYAVVEVTSHGIDQERVAGVDFKLGILTNITHEHLDYHKTFTNYRDTKRKLFRKASTSILNADDKSFINFKKYLEDRTKIINYSLKKRADYFVSNIHFNKKTSFSVCEKKKTVDLKTNVIGEYNVSNLLAAIAAARILKVKWSDIKKAVVNIKSPIGRLEKVKNKGGIDIFIDFAHTPDSLENVLSLLKEKTEGRLISVFGCAGERDVKKRKMMGGISARLADISVFTAEDPRSEDVDEIIDQITKGVVKTSIKEIQPKNLNDIYHLSDKKFYIRVAERGEAIAYAIQKLARKGDTIVICGKGHEKSMAYDSVEHPWSDKEFSKSVLNYDKNLKAILLAAGRGARMNDKYPKVLQKVAGRPMISYTLQNLRRIGFKKIIIVVGYQAEKVVRQLGCAVDYAYQKIPKGTGDALKKGLLKIIGSGDVIVLNGDDSAFYSSEMIKKVLSFHKKSSSIITFVSLIKNEPFGLGRIVRNLKGSLVGIVEEKEATKGQKKIKEVNDGLYIFNIAWVRKNIGKIEKSGSGEYYIIDLIKIALQQNKKVSVYKLGKSDVWFGVNTKEELELANKKMIKILNRRINF